MALPKAITCTLEDIYALPDGERAELINGHIYNMAPPSRIHQEILMGLSATLRDYILKNAGNCKVYPAPFAVFLGEDNKNYVEPDISVICDRIKLQQGMLAHCLCGEDYILKNAGNCKVYPAPFAVFLGEDNKNYVEPDISVICDRSKLTDKGCNGAPDFVIEIVSPSSRKMDYTTKNTLYSDFGVREYWIVDPSKEQTTIYRYEEDVAPMIVPFSLPITVGIYQNLAITISELLD